MTPDGSSRTLAPAALIPVVRLVAVAGVFVLVVAACGRESHMLSLRSTEAAVRAAGYSRLRVLDGSAASSRLRSEGVDVTGLRAGTPDFVIPEAVPRHLCTSIRRRRSGAGRTKGVRREGVQRRCLRRRANDRDRSASGNQHRDGAEKTVQVGKSRLGQCSAMTPERRAPNGGVLCHRRSVQG
jgi:hypothetical protein